MLLNESESRVAVAALQTLERTLAAQIQRLADPSYQGIPLPLRAALTQREVVTNLARKLDRGGQQFVDQREIRLTIRGLDRYVDLLNDCVAEHEEVEGDEVLSPQRKSREIELHRSSGLLERLASN